MSLFPQIHVDGLQTREDDEMDEMTDEFGDQVNDMTDGNKESIKKLVEDEMNEMEEIWEIQEQAMAAEELQEAGNPSQLTEKWPHISRGYRASVYGHSTDLRTRPDLSMFNITESRVNPMFLREDGSFLPLPAHAEVANSLIADEILPHGLAMQCTMDSCFDWEKCIKNMDWYENMVDLYSGKDIEWQKPLKTMEKFVKVLGRKVSTIGPKFYVYNTSNQYNVPDEMEWNFQAILDALYQHPWRTEDPKEACLFIPDINLMCAGNNCKVKNAEDRLKKLPYWNHGRNHIIITSNDWELQGFHWRTMSSTFDRAIIASTNHRSSYYRHGFDISLPLLPRWKPFRGFNPNNFLPIPINQRKYLVTFKGSRYRGCGAPTRNVLHWLNNDEDVIVKTYCKLDQKFDDHCLTDAKNFELYEFSNLTLNSRFGLAPRGCGRHSYRILDLWQVGTIPVILADEFVPFYEDLIPSPDWRACVVQIPESRLQDLESVLRKMSNDDVESRMRKCKQIWKVIFGDITDNKRKKTEFSRIAAMLEDLKARMWFYL